MDTLRQYLSGMPSSVTRVLIALIVAFSVAMPAGARVMPMVGTGMPMSTGMMEKTTDQPCQNCPDHQSGSTTPDKMPGCPALACIAAPAVVPRPTLLPGRVSYRTEYAWPVIALLAGADPVPDPFPPRPVVLL
jgi:hypothetical protein